jgi:hypothetical protein
LIFLNGQQNGYPPMIGCSLEISFQLFSCFHFLNVLSSK